MSKSHGKTGTRLFTIWVDMRQRCQNKNYPEFRYWGGKGVTVCEEWQTFENFYDWAISNGYDAALTLDRIDGDGNYCPENCRWATITEQCRNTKSNHKITINGETRLLCEWLELSPITASTYHKRKKRGMNDEEALFTPHLRNRDYYAKRR